MTWEEIKKQVEKKGVKDEDEIQFIDIIGIDQPIQVKEVPVFLRDRPAWEIYQ